MQIPLLGEVTAMRAFFLFLFFYSNDSNSLGTWSTFGAGMLLSNLGNCFATATPSLCSRCAFATARAAGLYARSSGLFVLRRAAAFIITKRLASANDHITIFNRTAGSR